MNETTGLLLALLFGIAYNKLYAHYGGVTTWGTAKIAPTGLWVTCGVLVVLVIAALVDDASAQLTWPAMATLNRHAYASIHLFKFFAAAGLPMVIGSVWRNWQKL